MAPAMKTIFLTNSHVGMTQHKEMKKQDNEKQMHAGAGTVLQCSALSVHFPEIFMPDGEFSAPLHYLKG
jgi:hypothetical protein